MCLVTSKNDKRKTWTAKSRLKGKRYPLFWSSGFDLLICRRKRSSKTSSGTPSGSTAGEENYWDCSVCTFRNNAEAFKCSMCDVRKGTSTRKPRLNPDLVAQQQAQALTPPPATGPIPSSSGLKSPASPADSVASSGAGGTGVGDEEETDLAALASLKANKRVAKDKLKKKEPKKAVNK